MDALRGQILENAALWLAWGGFAIGTVFGFVVQQTNFCAMGSISDIVSFEDYRRFRAWLLAAAAPAVIWCVRAAAIYAPSWSSWSSASPPT